MPWSMLGKRWMAHPWPRSWFTQRAVWMLSDLATKRSPGALAIEQPPEPPACEVQRHAGECRGRERQRAGEIARAQAAGMERRSEMRAREDRAGLVPQARREARVFQAPLGQADDLARHQLALLRRGGGGRVPPGRRQHLAEMDHAPAQGG